jgi:prefoldin subunit 5
MTNADGTFKLKTIDGNFVNYIDTWQIVLANNGADISYDLTTKKIRFVNGPYWTVTANTSFLRTHSQPYTSPGTNATIGDGAIVDIIDTTQSTSIPIIIPDVNVTVKSANISPTNNYYLKTSTGGYISTGDEPYAADPDFPDISKYLSITYDATKKMQFVKVMNSDGTFKMKNQSDEFIMTTKSTWQIVLSKLSGADISIDSSGYLMFAGFAYPSTSGKELRTHKFPYVAPGTAEDAPNTMNITLEPVVVDATTEGKSAVINSNISTVTNILGNNNVDFNSILTSANTISGNLPELVRRCPTHCGTSADGYVKCTEDYCINQMPGFTFLGWIWETESNSVTYRYGQYINKNVFQSIKDKIKNIQDGIMMAEDKLQKIMSIASTSINDTITTVSQLKSETEEQLANYQKASEELRTKIQKIADDANVLMAKINDDYKLKMDIVKKGIVESTTVYQNKLKEIQNSFSDLIDTINKSFDSAIERMQNNINDLRGQMANLQQSLKDANVKFASDLQKLKDTNSAEMADAQKAHDSQIEGLNKEISDAKEQIAIETKKLQDAKDNYDSQIKSAETAYKSELTRISNENDANLALIQSNYNTLKNKYESDVIQYTSMLKEQQDKTTNLQNVLNQLSISIEKNKKDISDAETLTKEQIDKLTDDYDTQLNIIETNKNQLNTDYDKLKTDKLNEFNTLISQLQQKEIDAITLQKNTSLTELQNIFDEISDAQKVYDKAQNEYSTKIGGLQNQISDLQSKISELNSDLYGTITKLSTEEKTKILSLLSDFSTAQKKTLDDAVAASQKIYDDLQNNINVLSSNKTELLNAIQNYQNQRDEIEKQYNETRDKLLGDASQYITDLIKDYTDVNTAKDAASKITLDKFLDDQLTEKKKSLSDLQTALDTLQKNKSDLEEQIKNVAIIQPSTSTSNSYLYYIVGGITLSILIYIIYKNQQKE